MFEMVMDMMRIGICDNEMQYITKIKNVCDDYARENKSIFQYEFFYSGEQVLDYKEDIVILFLDIQMDGMDGIQAMHALLQRKNVWKIVFVTNYDGRMLETFSLKTLGFVKKTPEKLDIKKWLSIAMGEIKRTKSIEVISTDKKILIRTEDIYYIQSDVNNIKLYSKDEIYYALGNIKHWEKQLKEYDFVRVHKSFIVNMEYIDVIDTDLYLRDIHKALPIGRTYKKELKEKTKQYILEKVRNRTDI